MPDIIISDVMMPDMDGKELCRLVKSNDNTAHIPLILLSARHSDEYKLEGLKLGCDDYITKPFNLDILNLKMQKLINLHNKHYRSKIDPSPSEIKITSMDEKLIESAVKYVENNISRSELSVEEAPAGLSPITFLSRCICFFINQRFQSKHELIRCHRDRKSVV